MSNRRWSQPTRGEIVATNTMRKDRDLYGKPSRRFAAASARYGFGIPDDQQRFAFRLGRSLDRTIHQYQSGSEHISSDHLLSSHALRVLPVHRRCDRLHRSWQFRRRLINIPVPAHSNISYKRDVLNENLLTVNRRLTTENY